VIQKLNAEYLLSENDFQINEVLISAKLAFELFNKSCKNTWLSFKNENLTRAYCKCEMKANGWVKHSVDLDLDISQSKQNRYKSGEQITSYIIQEHIAKKGSSNLDYINLTLGFFYPMIQQIYWIEVPDKFNYTKYEN